MSLKIKISSYFYYLHWVLSGGDVQWRNTNVSVSLKTLVNTDILWLLMKES